MTILAITLLRIASLHTMMPSNYNPLTDYSLAFDAEQRDIDAAFRSNPWCKNLHANGQVITREQWRKEAQERQAQQNGKAK
jgi:hypothetical protein